MSDFIIDENGCISEYIGKCGDIVIPHRVKAISGGAFINCPGKITSITFEQFTEEFIVGLPNTDCYIVSEDDTKYKSIDGVIYNQDGSTIIAVPSGFTKYTMPSSVKYRSSYAFYNSHLTEIDMSKVKGWSGSNLPRGLKKLILPEAPCVLPDLRKISELQQLVIPANTTCNPSAFMNSKLVYLEIKSSDFVFSSNMFGRESYSRTIPECIVHSPDNPLSYYSHFKKPIAVGILTKKILGLPVSDENINDAVKYIKRYGKDIDWEKLLLINETYAKLIGDYGLLEEDQLDAFITKFSAQNLTELVSHLIDAKEKLYPSSSYFDRLMKKLDQQTKSEKK